jgi:hypothetical protein
MVKAAGEKRTEALAFEKFRDCETMKQEERIQDRETSMWPREP